MSTPFLGEVRLFGFNFVPQDWHACDGSLLSIAQNDALFALLGTTYGGDGQTSFAVPDLRGQVPLHQGKGPGLTPRVIGEGGGSETVTLAVQQLGAHGHAFAVTSAVASTGTPSGRSEEHTSELQSLMRISYAVFCLKKKKNKN